MTNLKLISAGLVILREMLSRLNVNKRDVRSTVEIADRGYHLTPYGREFADKMTVADNIMQRYRETLHALAK